MKEVYMGHLWDYIWLLLHLCSLLLFFLTNI